LTLPLLLLPRVLEWLWIGWFDIVGLDHKAREDKAGFEESKTRIERVRRRSGGGGGGGGADYVGFIIMISMHHRW